MKLRTAGIDIGGTKIRWVILDGRHRVIRAREIKTPARRGRFLRSFHDILEDLRKRGVERIGIGVAGVVRGTTLKKAANLRGLASLDFRRAAPDLSIRVDNDAKCFARAEVRLGAGRRSKRMFAVIIGTGIGRAFAVGGRVVPVEQFESPEPWEAIYQKRKFGAARPLAKFLAEELLPIAARFDPDVLVLGGGRMREKGFFRSLRRELQAAGLSCSIRRSRLRQNGPAIGAALLMERVRP